MDREALFPDAWTDGKDERIAEHWDLSYPLPVPRVVPLCPMCGPFTRGGGRLVLKDWKFHKRTRTGSKFPWRCDVRLKCVDCSYVPIYGIAIPQQMWEHAYAHYCQVNQWISWRKGKQVLIDAGYLEGDG